MTQPAPLPKNEAQRLARLHELAVLDTDPEALFNTLARLAASLCGTPIALLSLVDEHRQWFKANIGLAGVTETPRDFAFCAHAIHDDEVMEVPDATRDPRFMANPLVTGPPNIRFYAGAPLRQANGVNLGTLCVIDHQPRILSDKQKQSLKELARIASQALALNIGEHPACRPDAPTHDTPPPATPETESEARYRAIVEDQSELISLANPEGRLTFVNAAYGRHFGRACEDILGTSLYDYIPEADQAAVRAHIARLLDKRSTLSIENRTIAADGQSRWMAWTNRVICDVHGRISGIHSVGRDITERKQAEASLQESQRRLRSLYESTPAMLHSIDAHGNLLTVSDTWLAKMGYSREDVIGRNSADFLAPSSHEYARSVVLPRYLLTGRCDNVEYQMVRKDGSLMDVKLSAIMERDANGQPVRSLAILEDITEKHAVEAALHANQERLSLATQANEIGIWEMTLPEGELTWSDMMFTIFGLPRDQFTGQLDDLIRCIHPDDLAYTRHELVAAIKGHKPLDFDFRVLHPNGHVRYVYGRAVVFRDAKGQATRILGANYDVTDRKLMERELAEKHELLRVTLHSIGDAVITTDAQGRVQWLNPVAERMTGWLSEAARGKPLHLVFHIVNELSRELEPSPFERCQNGQMHVGQVDHTLLISQDGKEYGIEDSAAPIRDAEGKMLGVVVVFRDVTEQRRMGHEMSFRATHDELTGLVNRAEFDKRLTRVLSEAQQHDTSHALMYIDLDQFKLVNDACGHSVGDQLLCQVTQLLQGCVRSRDTLARLGGDEFGVILEHCTVDQAHRVAQDICDQMEEFRFIHDGRRFRIGTSIGLVPLDKRWVSTAAVLQAADTSCYAAKEAGRNRVHAWFDTDQAMRVRKGEMRWASRLEQALDDNRFILYAQRIMPIHAAGATDALHCEILLRLREPDGSLILPNAFLPAAERFHMASRIDRWVVRHVFDWLGSQNQEGLQRIHTIAVNLSGQSISDPNFHRFMQELISDGRVDVSKLCLEITETAAVTNLADAGSFIDSMRERGVRMALDDFGSGASSFGYLKTLPVDYLKIDGQFIKDLVNDPLDQATVRCFCEVARVMNIQTVAEFVETPQALQALRDLGVDHAQGYMVHKPQPLVDLLSSIGCLH